MKLFKRNAAEWIELLLWVVIYACPLAILPLRGIDIFDAIKGPILAVASLSILFLLIKKGDWKLDIIDYLSGAWLVLILISALASPDPMLGVFGKKLSHGRLTTGRFEGWFTYLFYLTLFHAARRYFRPSTQHIKQYLSWMTLISIYAIIQHIYLDPLIHFRGYRPVIFSLIGNQNFLASLMVLLIFLSITFYRIEKKNLYLFLAALFLSTLVMSQTRSGWLAFLFLSVVGIVVGIWKKSKRDVLVFLGGIILFIGCFYGLNKRPNWFFDAAKFHTITLMDRGENGWNDIKNPSKNSGSGRIILWKISLKAALENPLLGSGPEQLKGVLEKQNDPDYRYYKKSRHRTVDRAHNEFLHVGGTQGIFALLLYLSILIILFVRNSKQLKDPLVLGLTMTLVAYWIQSFFNISVIAVAPVYWVVLGWWGRKLVNGE
ncbi:MAG: hypothetical protein RL138_532 [Bacteroidota bacterium]